MSDFRLLDLGSHDGYVTLWLARQLREQGHEVHVDGIDLMPEAVKIANRRFREDGFKGEFLQGDALKPHLCFPEHSYDAVVAFELIEHVVDPADLLVPVESMLKPEGLAYISTPDGTFGTGNNPHHLHAYRAIDLADILRRRGGLSNMTVGFDQVTVASYKPHKRLGDIAIFCGPGWNSWTPQDIELKGLGGSETAAVRLAQHLSRIGYVVTVYGEIADQQCFGDVIFKHWKTFDPTERREALISSRVPEIFDRPVNARVRLLWFHDTDAGDRFTPARCEKIDHVLCLSAWHKQHLEDLYPFAKDKLRQTRNGIEPRYFEIGEVQRNPHLAVYTSSPDRGLDKLLELWPKVREQVPDAELKHSYVDVYDAIAEQDPKIGAYRKKVADLADQPGVESIGHLSQPEVAKLMRSAGVWCHPSWSTPSDSPFHETSCLSPDTLIDMPRDYRTHPDGVPIKELEGRSNFPVYAWNESEHRFTLATAKKCWKSRENANTIEIDTEEGTTLTCTPDHKVLTFDGDWVEAGTLKPGDRLRGLNYRFQVNVNLGDGKWTGEHRMVGEWMEGRQLASNEHVHHLDETRLDNRPESLRVMSASEHHSLTHSGREYSREWKAKRRDLSNAWKVTPEGVEHYRRNAQKAGQNLWEWLDSLPEVERKQWLSDRATLAAASRREAVAAMSPEDQAAESQKMAERGKKGSQRWWDYFRTLPEEEQQAWLKDRAEKAAAAKREKKGELVANHRVKSVRPGPTVDVYDMEVEEHHNFVAGGVVVHNCIGAMEAQAAGCLAVVSSVGALRETVLLGRRVEAEQLSERWQDVFIRMIVEGMTNKAVQDHVQAEAPALRAKWGWDGVARQVTGLINGEEWAFGAR